MRSSAAVSLFLVAAVSSLLGCRQNDDPSGASELLARVQEAGYQEWSRAPGYPGREASSAPHGDEVEIFVNDVVEEALGEDALGAWPEGAIIVKDGYSGGQLELIAIAEKRASGWFWAEYDGTGEVLYSGAPDVCVDCHASGDDYVRAFSLP